MTRFPLRGVRRPRTLALSARTPHAPQAAIWDAARPRSQCRFRTGGISTEIDGYSTFVAATARCVDTLLPLPDLETVQTNLTAPIAAS